MEFLSTVEVFAETGLVFSILAMGYYVTYHILDFPDLTVEGTFLTGASAFGITVSLGLNPWLGMLFALIAGAMFGALTGVIHVFLKIRPLLCGILVSTLLITVNLVTVTAYNSGNLLGAGSASLSFGREVETLRDCFFGDAIPARIDGVNFRDLIIFAVIAVGCKIMLDAYFKSKNGLLLRATGSNGQFVKMLGADPGKSKIIGLAIGNGYAAVSGALFSQISSGVNQSMGIGTVVIGLASLIIGISLFAKVKFLEPTTKVIIGAIIYQACLTVAQKLGVPSAYNKLIMAVMFTLALVLSAKMKGGRKNA